MATNSDKLYSDTFAYDLSSDILSKGEVYNEDAINVSINNILSTLFTERLFKVAFGSALQLLLFDTISTTSQLQTILNGVTASLKQWEPRIIVIEDQCAADFNQDTHILQLKIPYIINKSGIVNSFETKIRI